MAFGKTTALKFIENNADDIITSLIIMGDGSMEYRVKENYENGNNLNTRMSLHSKYSINKQGFNNWAFEQYDFSNGVKILELGCGVGNMWFGRKDILERIDSLIMSDFSEGILAEAENNLKEYSNVSYKVIDITDIPFDHASFDVVIANQMLYHIKNKQKAVSEVARVLKKGGKFYCSTYGENNITNWASKILAENGIIRIPNLSFTLQNGSAYLKPFFPYVESRIYEDGFKILDTNDLLDYLISSVFIKSGGLVDREVLFNIFDKEKDKNGIIIAPKEQGTFICIT